MKTKSVGFIGGGRITRIFLQAFVNHKVEFKSVVVFDTNNDVLATLKQKFPFIETGELLHAASQHTVFIALHPPMIMETLDKITNVVSEDTLVISLAPKITIEKIASKLKTRNIVRMIPNATSYINEGFNPVSFSAELSKDDKKSILRLLKNLGKTFETDEAKLESYAIVSAMLPTYFWFQWQEMETIATQTGLSEREARKAIQISLKKAIRLYFNSGLSPTEVMDLVPVKPIGEQEMQIREIYQTKLMKLFGNIKP
ncbi:MAG: NAD(P)-binding domain-containing protein [Prolixibacteraceae bacterium]|jgi:pyrroline-5-carboxylate reductase|nr:NAD(P)-binding domain-containing protein [Prolixibacteraceae bacterium]